MLLEQRKIMPWLLITTKRDVNNFEEYFICVEPKLSPVKDPVIIQSCQEEFKGFSYNNISYYLVLI